MADHQVIIIGGGISGLSALHFLKSRSPDLSVHLYESNHRLGGTIGTDHIKGYSFDRGPNGFLDREPLTLQLCDELGLNSSIERANKNVSKRFILRKGKLRAVPMSPPKFLTSDILSLFGRLRVMMEPLAKGRGDVEDESIYDFARRRIGREAADFLVQPMVSGVYGGLADKMSLKSTFKIMYEMESEYGSLLKAMIAKAKAARKKKKKAGGPAGPGGWLTSFNSGLNVIIERLDEICASDISTGIAVAGIEKENGEYRLSLNNGDSVKAKHLILAVPSYCAAKLTGKLNSDLSTSLNDIAYAPISVVCMGYSENMVKRPVDGFGFLVPQKENINILGSIWTSSIFKERAPVGKVQFRTMIGGDGDHESIELSDDGLTELVAKDLDRIIGLKGDPELMKIYRWKQGIPQYHIGHAKKITAIESAIEKLGNIYLTGNAFYGISLNDCVRQSHTIAGQIIDLTNK